jgi:secreted PhoX family phosphatase
MLVACGGEDGSDGADGVNGTDGVAGDSAPVVDTVDDTVSGVSAIDLTSIVFTGVEAPATDVEKRTITASEVTIDGKVYGGAYKTLVRSGEDVNGMYFGQLIDESGSVLKSDDGEIEISDSNEFTSILPIGEKLFSVSQFESKPGAMFLMELNQDAVNGELSVKNMSQIDQSGIDGGWTHCSGSVTPWTTHLASEEYEPNARSLISSTEAESDRSASAMMDYYSDSTEWNPYFYGWNIEVSVTEDAEVTSTKHYAMGRLAFELSYVMPDEKTTYMTDDGTNVGLYMFVADTAGDLSAGTAYAAKWNQTSSEGLGEADLEWISLGHATDAEIQDYVKGTNGQTAVTFADIFTASDATEDVCPDDYTSINAGGNGLECLQLNDGMETLASRLETRRYAAYLGATTEFRKEEGITYDATRSKLYIGMSSIEKGMMDDDSSNDLGGPNHIALDEKNKCGGVYELDLAANADMGSDYIAQNMSGLIAGRPVDDSDYGDTTEPQVVGYEDNNKCHIDGISNPDNVAYMTGYDKLIVGEDTGSGHQNDVIWAYDFDSKDLVRIQTTPYGAETTSPYWYPNINGWAYMTSVVQHPYGESDSDEDTGAGEARAYTGYVGPFPSVN